MIALLANQFVLLAESDWTRLIGIVVVFGFYVIGAIVKMLGKRSSDSENGTGAEETSEVLDLAKKYAKQRQAQPPQSKPARNNEFISEWDRQQEIKRQQLGRLHDQRIQPPAPVQIPKGRPKPAAAPVPAKMSPQYRKFPNYQKAQPAASQRQPVQPRPKYVNIQPPQFPPKPQKNPMPMPAVKTKQSPAEITSKTPATRPRDIILRHPNELRSAIILKEILDKPVALREDGYVF